MMLFYLFFYLFLIIILLFVFFLCNGSMFYLLILIFAMCMYISVFFFNSCLKYGVYNQMSSDKIVKKVSFVDGFVLSNNSFLFLSVCLEGVEDVLLDDLFDMVEGSFYCEGGFWVVSVFKSLFLVLSNKVFSSFLIDSCGGYKDFFDMFYSIILLVEGLFFYVYFYLFFNFHKFGLVVSFYFFFISFFGLLINLLYIVFKFLFFLVLCSFTLLITKNITLFLFLYFVYSFILFFIQFHFIFVFYEFFSEFESCNNFGFIVCNFLYFLGCFDVLSMSIIFSSVFSDFVCYGKLNKSVYFFNFINYYKSLFNKFIVVSSKCISLGFYY